MLLMSSSNVEQVGEVTLDMTEYRLILLRKAFSNFFSDICEVLIE